MRSIIISSSRMFATAFTPPPHGLSISTSRSILQGYNDCRRRRQSFSYTHNFYKVPLSTLSISYAQQQIHQHGGSLQSIVPITTKLYSSSPTSNNNEQLYTSSSSTTNDDINEMADPYSEEAKANLLNFYKHHSIPLTDQNNDIEIVHNKLLRLSEEVLDWNTRLNLVSRKDCTVEVVYYKHVLPSMALLPLILKKQQQSSDDSMNETLNVIDVGTGGGFPGLPLALLLPKVQFTLVDSIQKKLKAVSEMAAELEISNIRIHWGRVEEMYVGKEGRAKHYNKYNIVLGRSVTALPRFCSWISDLLYKDTNGYEENDGNLIYIIGGDLEDVVTTNIVKDIPLDTLLQRDEVISDKRAVIFNACNVEEIAMESDEKIVRRGSPSKKKGNQNRGRGGKNKLAKGAWSRKQNDVKKERGYNEFKRYEF